MGRRQGAKSGEQPRSSRLPEVRALVGRQDPGAGNGQGERPGVRHVDKRTISAVITDPADVDVYNGNEADTPKKKKIRIKSVGKLGLDGVPGPGSCASPRTVRRVFADPGVRRELTSWRWLTIYALLAVYAAVFASLWSRDPPFFSRNSSDPPESELGGESSSAKTRPIEQTHEATMKDGNSHAIEHSRGSFGSASQELARSSEAVAHDSECHRQSARAAGSALSGLRTELQEAKPPLVFGGIGDSGTRAIAYLVTQLGVWMGKYGDTVKKDSRDSKLFISGFPTISCEADGETPQEGVIKSYVFYSRSLEFCGSLAYNHSCVGHELTWDRGTQWTSALFRTLWKDTQLYSTKRSNKEMYAFGLWGFKHPRSSFILPYINHVLGNRFKYVHILRDGRDIAAGDNQYFFNSVCKKYHTPDSPLCEDTYENKLVLWSRLNLDVLHWAKANLNPDQFLVVRIEDLVLGDASCFERIANFTETAEARANAVIAKSVRLFTVKEQRYFGLKYPLAQRKQYTEAVTSQPFVRHAFQVMGYGAAPWRPTGSCSDFPTYGFLE